MRERAARYVALAHDDARAGAILAELLAAAPTRLSGSAGAEAAVLCGERMMRALGFESVRLEEVVVPHWERGEIEEASVRVGEDAPQALSISALGGSAATSAEGVEGEIVEVRSFEELRALGDAARGKVVFFNRAMDPREANTFRAYGMAVDQRSAGGVEATKAGGVAALVRSMTTRLDDVPHTGAMRALLEDGKTPAVPTAAVSTAGAERIAALLRSGRGPVRAKLLLSCRTLEDVTSANVVGEIRGSERPDEIVLAAAHLDAWDTGQGAHDDGAGCAHVLEALRLIRAEGTPPKRTIRAVLFMNEENGLRGGRAYAQAHKSETHVFAIESDRGGFSPRAFSCDSKSPHFSELAEIVAPLDLAGCGRLEAGGGGADLSPLAALGVPVGELLTEPARYFDFHHARTDVLEAVDPGELETGAAALAYVLSALADGALTGRSRSSVPASR